jgi:excisionase family DNA binding protein
MLGIVIQRSFTGVGLKYTKRVCTDKLVLKTREVAEVCNVTTQTVKNWIYKGKLRALKTPGKHHRVPVEELQNFIAGGGHHDQRRA